MTEDPQLVRIHVPRGVRVLVSYEDPALPPRTIDTTAEEVPPSSRPGLRKVADPQLRLVGKVG